MKLSEIEKKLILAIQETISEDELKTNFDKQVELLETKFKSFTKLKKNANVYSFLVENFEKLKNSRGTKSSITAKLCQSLVLTFVEVNFEAEEFYSLNSLFGILLGLSLEVSVDKYENVTFEISRMSKSEHFKFIGSYINYQGDLPENFTEKVKIEKENYLEKFELHNPNEVTKINKKDDTIDDDLLDDDNDNFFYSHDADEIEDNYEGLEWDSYE